MPERTYQPGDLIRYTARGHLIAVGTICRISENQENALSPRDFLGIRSYWVDIPYDVSGGSNVDEDGWWIRRFWCEENYFEFYSARFPPLPEGAEAALTNIIDKLRQT